MALGSMAGLLVTGCDWSSGGGSDGYNSRYSWADFSGVYRGFNGGLLITDYSATPGTDGTPDTTNSVSGEAQGTTSDNTRYSGTLSRRPIVPGSLSITADGTTFRDQGNGTMTGGTGNNTIDYGTGQWSIDFIPGTVAPGQSIRAAYRYVVAGTSGTTGTGPGPGTTGIRIFSFSVGAVGENITVTDNNGSQYTGKLGNTRVNEGTQNAAGGPGVGDTVVMQYSVSGTSAAGRSVKMVGTFQGVVRANNGVSVTLADRRMFGTWIESPGKTGDINGFASPITVANGGSADLDPAIPAATVAPAE
jgi:hypothetical protein